MLNDEELIFEIKNGNAAAMEILVKNYYKSVFSYIYRNIGSDYHTSYDLTQEVFIKVIKYIKNYKEKGKLINWILTISVNTCIDYYRSNDYKNQVNREDLKTKLTKEYDSVYNILDRKLERQMIMESLQKLPIYQKEVIILKFYHDLKLKDIAKITQSNEATTKTRLYQGLSKLGKLLQGGERIEKKQHRL